MVRKPDIPPLTSLRFFAAAFVVLFHLRGIAPFSRLRFAPWIAAVASHGYLGVGLFFVLSGFILGYVYEDLSRLDLRGFWRARFARVYPLYLFSLIFALPFFFGHNLPALSVSKQYSIHVLFWYETITHPLMLQSWFMPLPPDAISNLANWNGPTWTLSCEAFFYLCFPVISIWVYRARHVKTVMIALWIATLIPTAIAFWWTPGDVGVSVMNASPFFRIGEFTIGICASRLHFPRASLFASLILLILCLGLQRTSHLVDSDEAFFSIAFVLLIGGLASGELRFLNRIMSSRPLVMLGAASYATYLLHVPLMYWQEALLRRKLLPPLFEPTQHPVFSLSAYMVLLVAISIAANLWIEVKARRWINSRAAAPVRTTYAAASRPSL